MRGKVSRRGRDPVRTGGKSFSSVDDTRRFVLQDESHCIVQNITTKY